MEENDFEAKGYQIEDIAWLKSKDKPLGRTASLGIWLYKAEAAEWVVYTMDWPLDRDTLEALSHTKSRGSDATGAKGLDTWSCKEQM